MSEDNPTNNELLNGFRLGDFQILPRAEEIKGPDGARHMEPRVMLVLVTLAQHAGRIVTRDELMNSVWSDAVVGDEVLSRAISLLRSALGDERTNPRFIRTIPRRGYELVAEVTSLAPPEEAPAAAQPPSATPPPAPDSALAAAPATAPSRHGRLPRWGAIAAAIALAAVALGLLMGNGAGKVSLAVIPFDAGTLPENQRYSGEAIADQLINQLTGVKELSVIARRSSFQLRDTPMDVRAIGESLHARYLVEGAVSQNHEQLSVTLYLVDADLGANLWTETVDGFSGDLHGLGARAYDALMTELVSQLDIPAQPTLSRPQTGLDEPAYRKYLEAKYQWSLRGEPRLLNTIALLEQAIALKADFAVAHLALAEAVAALPFYTDQSVEPAFIRAREGLANALALDPTLKAEVDALEGMMLMHEQRWQQARATLNNALHLKPDSIYGNYWQSMLLSFLGDYKTALKHIQRAQQLDPVSAVINDRLALAYLWVNDNAAAAERYHAGAELGYLESTQPKPFILFLVRTGQFAEIQAMLQRIGFRGDWINAFVTGLQHPEQRAASAEVVDQAIVAGLIPREFWFGIWMLLGDADRAIRDFDPGMKTQDIEVLWSAEGKVLRDDPRFPALLARVNLEP